MHSNGILLVVSGPSGVGKGTICKELMRKYPNIVFSVSMTTREPRVGEIDGVNYHFTDKETFEKMIENDEFLEYAHVYGNYYGTPIKYVEESLKMGDDILLEIDIQGAMQVKKRFPKGVYVFILPPSMKELKNRIIKRGSETQSSLETRYSNAIKELELAVAYDYYIINDQVESAVQTLEIILKAEKQRVSDGLLAFINNIKES